jgi:mannitol 2-dehydrogenase
VRKSTLLRLIAGLEDATGGAILIDGVDVIDQPPAKRGLSMVFQSYALYPHMTVRNNIGFGLRMAGVDTAERNRKVEEAAALLNLTPYLERRPGALSGGQRQRVAIGRAIVREPKAFLFDEPLSNLDAALRVNMRLEIARLQDSLGTTAIYVTHDQVEAMTMADKIVVLNAGRVEQVGSPLELYSRPANLFVAGFIGSPKMNLIQGDIARQLGGDTVGVRPEHLTVSRESGSWPGAVEIAEHLGSDTFLYITVDGVGRLTARAPGEFPLETGDRVWLTPRPESIHRFDANGRPSDIEAGGTAGIAVKDSNAHSTMTIPLRQAALEALSGRAAIPRYRGSDLRPGILHFGVGNFHRAHQAVYLDDLFNEGADLDWAIVGAGVREADKTIRAKLGEQDWLTTVVEQEKAGASARITAPMVDFVPPGDTTALLDKLSDPAIRIVSLTITEGGYFIDPASGQFNPEHPEIVRDARSMDAPQTVFGLILAGLIRRRQRGIAPFTVMSCDNLPGNGHVTSNAVAGLAALVDPSFAAWVGANVAFPNGMVDRITPATSDRERRMLAEDFGIEDSWPVFCERFKQWVLEDHFPAGRPALERVGVTFVPDVAPYELMKIRILNGGHATIAYPAALMDIHFVHEALEEPLVRGFLEKVERDEIIPVVPPVPDTDLGEYYRLIETRFANPRVGDTIQRLCLDGSNRQPKFILPSVRDRLREGRSVTGLAMVSAFWARYCFGQTDSGSPIPPNDPKLDPAAIGRAVGEGRPESFSRHGRHLRRARAKPGLPPGFLHGARCGLEAGHARNAARLSGG